MRWRVWVRDGKSVGERAGVEEGESPATHAGVPATWCGPARMRHAFGAEEKGTWRTGVIGPQRSRDGAQRPEAGVDQIGPNSQARVRLMGEQRTKWEKWRLVTGD